MRWQKSRFLSGRKYDKGKYLYGGIKSLYTIEFKGKMQYEFKNFGKIHNSEAENSNSTEKSKTKKRKSFSTNLQ